jgi:hypothetical protein
MTRKVYAENITMTVQISYFKVEDKGISLTIFDTISVLFMDEIQIDAENKQDKRLWTAFL